MRRVTLFPTLLVLSTSLVVAVLGASTSGVARAATPTLRIIDLGTLGGSFSSAFGVNASGQVVGFSSIAGDAASHAFSWTENGGMVDLGSLGGTGTFSSASAVSASGQVVGSSQIAGFPPGSHAFSWTESGGMVDLGTLGGSFSAALGVNASGQVVGSSQAAGNTAIRATLWQ